LQEFEAGQPKPREGLPVDGASGAAAPAAAAATASRAGTAAAAAKPREVAGAAVRQPAGEVRHVVSARPGPEPRAARLGLTPSRRAAAAPRAKVRTLRCPQACGAQYRRVTGVKRQHGEVQGWVVELGEGQVPRRLRGRPRPFHPSAGGAPL